MECPYERQSKKAPNSATERRLPAASCRVLYDRVWAKAVADRIDSSICIDSVVEPAILSVVIKDSDGARR